MIDGVMDPIMDTGKSTVVILIPYLTLQSTFIVILSRERALIGKDGHCQMILYFYIWYKFYTGYISIAGGSSVMCCTRGVII
jgi:hypothetical protein